MPETTLYEVRMALYRNIQDSLAVLEAKIIELERLLVSATESVERKQIRADIQEILRVKGSMLVSAGYFLEKNDPSTGIQSNGHNWVQ